jgi:hypothetical protein
VHCKTPPAPPRFSFLLTIPANLSSTVVCSIIRIPALNSAFLDGDITWDAVESHKWSNVEIHVATVVACIPAIKPLISALFGHGADSSTKKPGSKTVYWKNASGKSTLETIGGSGKERGMVKLGGSVLEDDLELDEKSVRSQMQSSV